MMMNGLEEYIKIHGRHFTDKLADAIAGDKWTIKKVSKATKKQVYYNVTSSTDGDMLYLIDMANKHHRLSFTKSIQFTLDIIGSYPLGNEYAFNHFISTLLCDEKDFDFSAYI